MLSVLLTVICYTVSSLGDKHISAKLKCTPAEFTFIVSGATALWLGCMLPFTGFGLKPDVMTVVWLVLLIAVKLAEFYISAILLKTVSAYELKAWLGINIVLSYVCNVAMGKSLWKNMMVLWSLLLAVGITFIVKAGNSGKISKRQVLLCMLFVLSKLFYGIVMGYAADENDKVSLLIVVMLAVALTQLSKLKVKEILYKKGIGGAAATRLANAGGLLFEAMAAEKNIFLYAMVQPAQLLILFAVSLLQREKICRLKMAGSIISILSIFLITIWQLV